MSPNGELKTDILAGNKSGSEKTFSDLKKDSSFPAARPPKKYLRATV
jgi:hypothetical protein